MGRCCGNFDFAIFDWGQIAVSMGDAGFSLRRSCSLMARLAVLENDEEGWIELPRALPWARIGWPFRPQETEAARQRGATGKSLGAAGDATVANEYDSFFMVTV